MQYDFPLWILVVIHKKHLLEDKWFLMVCHDVTKVGKSKSNLISLIGWVPPYIG
jgi:hypothetical protein